MKLSYKAGLMWLCEKESVLLLPHVYARGADYYKCLILTICEGREGGGELHMMKLAVHLTGSYHLHYNRLSLCESSVFHAG